MKIEQKYVGGRSQATLWQHFPENHRSPQPPWARSEIIMITRGSAILLIVYYVLSLHTLHRKIYKTFWITKEEKQE